MSSAILSAFNVFPLPVCTPAFGEGDTFSLPCPDERSFEFGERPYHGQHERGHRRVVSREDEVFLHEAGLHLQIRDPADGPTLTS